jgi:tetratricopeptide (TPR) repeat protein
MKTARLHFCEAVGKRSFYTASAADLSAPPFWQALVRHGVVQAVIAYVALGWIAIQFADTTFANLNLPAWTVPFVTFVVVGGLPVVILLSWFLEIAEGRVVNDRGQHQGGLLAGLGRNYLAIVAAFVVSAGGAGVYQALVGFSAPGTADMVAFDVGNVDELLPVHDNSLAVLRFQNLDGSDTTEVFSAGLSEDVLDRVARVPGLLVASRTDSWSLTEPVTSQSIRRRLRVAYFLEGTVRIIGNEIIVVAQFINSATGFHLFSKEISAELDRLNEVEQEITNLIVSELKVTLPEEIQAVNTLPVGVDGVDAYQLYRMGKEILYGPLGPERLEEARELFQQALELDSQYGAAHAGLCIVALNAHLSAGTPGELERAENNCGKAVAMSPRLPIVHRSLGRLYHSLGRLDEAIAAYETALTINEQDVEAMLRLGEVYSRREDYERAKELTAQAIDLQPGNWRAYNALGGMHFVQGQYDAAADAYRRVLLLDAENFVVMGNLATIRMMSGDFENARRGFEKTLEISHHPFFLSNLGLSHYYLGEFDKAVEVHRRNVQSSPDLTPAWVNFGDALYFAGKEKEAANAFRRATELSRQSLDSDPSNPETLTYLAWAETMLGNTSAGTEYAERAVELATDDPYSHYYRALVALRSGDESTARRALRKAVDLGYSELMLDAEPYLADLRR